MATQTRPRRSNQRIDAKGAQLKFREKEAWQTIALMIGGALGVLIGIAQLSAGQVGWFHIIMWNLFYWPSALGVTLGNHRLFTHESFETTKWMRAIIAGLSALAPEGIIRNWVETHLVHHTFSDTEYDPHSPQNEGGFRGFWHAHIEWMKSLWAPIAKSNVANDPIVSWVDKHMLYFVAATFLIPTLTGSLLGVALFYMPWWAGALDGFLWGGLVRVFFVHHVTWSINSFCHILGRRDYATSEFDESRNFWPTPLKWGNPEWSPWWRYVLQPLWWAIAIYLSVLSLGESNHNAHHAAPSNARHGYAIRWYQLWRWPQLDFTYLIIRGLEKVGLAWNVKQNEDLLERQKARAKQAA